MTTADLTTMTPVEIDTILAAIYGEVQQNRARYTSEWEHAKYSVRSYLGQGTWDTPTRMQMHEAMTEVEEISNQGASFEDFPVEDRSSARRLSEHMARIAILDAAYENLVLSQEPYEREYVARGRWTRAFLVNNSNGHVHRSMSCSTCFPTTDYVWLPELSGHDEAEIVDLAGDRACTICYPSAPVEVLAQATRLFTPDEKAAQVARQEREQKRQERDAAAITATVYDYGNTRRPKVFKSERAATNYIASRLSDLCWYGPEHPSAHQWATDITTLREALMGKGLTYDYDKALAAARKKVTREGGTAKF